MAAPSDPVVPSPQPMHLWDEDGFGAPEISKETHLKTVDKFRRTVNGDPVVVFTDGTTLTFYAPLQRGSTYVPLSVLYREKVARGRRVPIDRVRQDGNVQREMPTFREANRKKKRKAKAPD